MSPGYSKVREAARELRAEADWWTLRAERLKSVAEREWGAERYYQAEYAEGVAWGLTLAARRLGQIGT